MVSVYATRNSLTNRTKTSIKPPLTALKNVFVQGFGSAGCPERNTQPFSVRGNLKGTADKTVRA